ncbi:MAG TPA: AraC family transcriptional regulator [Petrimonas sp.]|uniref:AraC family transcriptional regulator n=1 Tax=Petrimonas sp. TaxID=2023866 RepID=UPI001773552F|nr:helix-turn-helix transcriptional regulator [Petrimonas sp.]HHV84252.1 AraC family transcriptional regulator [Petrimonas sp.]
MAKKLNHFTFDNIPTTQRYVIEEFIMSDGNSPRNISIEHPFIFEGILFVICLKGTGQVLINFKEYSVTENSIITIPPNVIVQITDHSEDFLTEMIAFSADYLVDMPMFKDFDLLQKMASQPVLNITEEESRAILNYYMFIITVFNGRKHILFNQVIKGLLYSLVMTIAVKYIDGDTAVKKKPSERNKESERSKEITQQFFSLLRKYHKQERAASFYADKLCITVKYLSKTIKNNTGRSVNSWLEDSIIMSAKILLKSSDSTIMQISEELNFPNPSYFGRYFKKATGMTPKEYREQ